MSTHNIGFRGEIRKMSLLLDWKKRLNYSYEELSELIPVDKCDMIPQHVFMEKKENIGLDTHLIWITVYEESSHLGTQSCTLPLKYPSQQQQMTFYFFPYFLLNNEMTFHVNHLPRWQ